MLALPISVIGTTFSDHWGVGADLGFQGSQRQGFRVHNVRGFRDRCMVQRPRVQDLGRRGAKSEEGHGEGERAAGLRDIG